MSLNPKPGTVIPLGRNPGPATPVPPEQPQEDAVIALRHLLRVEGEIRACCSVDELGILLVNEVRRMTGARSAYFLDLRSRRPQITKASGAGEIDRNAPAMQWLEQEFSHHIPDAERQKPSPVSLRIGLEGHEDEARLFPFPQGYWLPLRYRDERPDAGILVVGEEAFADGPIAIGSRVAETAAHAAIVLDQRAPRRAMRHRYKLAIYGLLIAACAGLFYPVPMTALAPMEVVPRDPFVIAAPIDGVIDGIVVAPNSVVKAGDVVVQYVDTVSRNQLLIAEQEVSVAVAKLRQLQQSAFVDDSAKRELAQSRAELKLKIAERDFARDTFEKSRIRSARNGIAIYADRKEWVGKPVATGQRILEVADESKVRLRADLPVAEVLTLKPGARVRAFLNGDPLHPIDAKVISTSHQAQMVEGEGLVYRVDAEFDAAGPPPRPGVRGTAQLFSEKAPLGYYLFRRPLTWLRQKVGL